MATLGLFALVQLEPSDDIYFSVHMTPSQPEKVTSVNGQPRIKVGPPVSTVIHRLAISQRKHSLNSLSLSVTATVYDKLSDLCRS